jgi:hypothetical protein
MGLVNDFLALFGYAIERRPPSHITTNNTTAGISERFAQDSLRQQSQSFYFHKGLARPRRTFADDSFNDYLRDGSAQPPRR